jgi:hypothetical protein
MFGQGKNAGNLWMAQVDNSGCKLERIWNIEDCSVSPRRG